MSPAEILARVRRVNRKLQPPVTIALTVFTGDDRVPVRVISSQAPAISL